MCAFGTASIFLFNLSDIIIGSSWLIGVLA